jgi:hypothetical protein
MFQGRPSRVQALLDKSADNQAYVVALMMVEDRWGQASLVLVAHPRRIDQEDRQVEHRHGMTLELLREHLARADGELEATQHLLDPGSAEVAEMDLIRADAAARVASGDALEAVRLRVGERDRG